MRESGCELCRKARVVALSLLLGSVAGLGADAAGASQTWSMLATFAGAIAPLLWWARRNRFPDGGD